MHQPVEGVYVGPDLWLGCPAKVGRTDWEFLIYYTEFIGLCNLVRAQNRVVRRALGGSLNAI